MTIHATPTGLRPDIADTLNEYDLEADREGFVGLKIAPAKDVDLQSGTYPVSKLSDRLKSAKTLRNSDGTYNSVDIGITDAPYKTEEHGMEARVDERNKQRYKHLFDADIEAGEVSRDIVMRNQNAHIIRKALGIANVTDVTASSGIPWSTPETASPIDDVRAGRINVRNRCGLKPNVLVVEFEVFEFLRDSKQIIDRVKYGGLQNVNRSEVNQVAIASALGLEEVIVADSVAIASNQNQAVQLGTQWDKTKALLFYRSTKGTRHPQFMRTFHWSVDGSRIGGTFDKYWSEAKRSMVVRSRMETMSDVVYEACGEILDNVAA